MTSTKELEQIKPDQIDEVVKYAHGGNAAIVETSDFRAGVAHALYYLSRQPKIRFTPTESYCVNDVIGRVIDALSWDNSTGYYEDGGNFIYRCSKADYLALKRALKKV